MRRILAACLAAGVFGLATIVPADTKPDFKPYAETIAGSNLSFEMIPIRQASS